MSIVDSVDPVFALQLGWFSPLRHLYLGIVVINSHSECLFESLSVITYIIF